MMEGRARIAGILVAMSVAVAVIVTLWSHPPLFLSGGNHVPIGEGAALRSFPRSTLEQTFVASGERVDGIGLIVATAGITGGVIELTVEEADPGRDASPPATLITGIRSITDWQNHVFRVSGFPTRPGEEYRFSIKTNRHVSFYVSQDDTYERGALTSDGWALTRDLVFRIYERRTLSEIASASTPEGIPGWVVMFLLAGFVSSIGVSVCFIITGKPRRASSGRSCDVLQ